ncbi:hypothetical protein BRC95_07930 [Halobacteriales archaeon QS_5_68_33]|nr:MAG: hypothetical protein BRC95_07930 [Halobacteriales archaeon QS_5_68_33]
MLSGVFDGVDAACYIVHSLGLGGDFDERLRRTDLETLGFVLLRPVLVPFLVGHPTTVLRRRRSRRRRHRRDGAVAGGALSTGSREPR